MNYFYLQKVIQERAVSIESVVVMKVNMKPILVILLAIFCSLGGAICPTATQISYRLDLEPTIALDFASDTTCFTQPVIIKNGAVLTLEIETNVALHNSNEILLISNKTKLQVPPATQKILSLVFLFDKDVATKLTENLKASVSLTLGFLSLVKVSHSQEMDLCLPVTPDVIRDFFELKDTLKFPRLRKRMIGSM